MLSHSSLKPWPIERTVFLMKSSGFLLTTSQAASAFAQIVASRSGGTLKTRSISWNVAFTAPIRSWSSNTSLMMLPMSALVFCQASLSFASSWKISIWRRMIGTMKSTKGSRMQAGIAFQTARPAAAGAPRCR